ncbi:MAG: hypothetical protein DWP97_06025 [Calditrichaeota bacterium]|nr:MAG: hypothetical protein DWP97_06025 [Calditrichota bacterium]
MIKLTAIKEENAHFQLTLSDNRKLSIPPETAIEHKLVSGIVLTDSQVEILLQADDLFRCMAKAKQYLANRGHSTGELKLKLKKKAFAEESITKVINKLTQLDFLNDREYALAIGEKLLNRKPCGKPFLSSFLQSKSISRDLAEQTAQMLYQNRDISQLAVDALSKKWYMYNDLELEDARNKSYNYLARRGFTYETAKTAFETILKEKKD